MMDLITEHIATWTAAEIQKANGGRGRGRGSNGQGPHGIKKLRELILELAVRGKLVPQDPNDEPASVLLEKIAKEKARLIKEGKIKKQMPLPKITVDEEPFDLPEGWEWFRAGDVFDFQYGKAMPSKSRDVSGAVDVYGSNGIVGNHTEALVDKPCIVIGRKGSAGALNKALKPSWTTDVSYFLIPPQGFDFDYTFLLLQSLRLDELGKGIKPGLNRNEAYVLVSSLPPLAEQYRIVAKIDELMDLCDKLEQQQTDSNETHQALVETLLATLTTVADPAEFALSWQRIAGHFDTLFTTEESIDQLKQTILQLAVMGKLVSQDPNDEPASTLLEKIAKEKAKLIKEGKIKKEKPLPKITLEDALFSPPTGWSFTRFESVVNITSGVTKGRKLAGRKVATVPYLRVANVQRGFLDLDLMKEIEIPEDELEKFTVMDRDLLITEGGDWDKVGRTASWRGELPMVAHQNHVFKARLLIEEQNELWLEKYLNSLIAREYFASSSKQTTNLASINKTQLRGCIVPIPPLAEQHRIVAKVDELMALCDTLKERLHDAQITQVQLADAIVEQVVA